MYRYILLINFISISLSVFSQSINSEKAISYAENGDYENAIRLEKEGLKLLEAKIGKDNIKYKIALYNLGTFCIDAKDEDATNLIFNQIANSPLSLKQDCNYDYFIIMDRIADYYAEIFDFDRAISVRQKLIKLMEDAWNKDALDFFSSLLKLSSYYIDSGNYIDAINLGIEMKDIYKNNRELYCHSLINLAESYSFIGIYDKAIELSEESLKQCNPDDWETTYVLKNNLANYYDLSNQSDKALEIETEILEIISGLLPIEHPHYIASLALLGRYFSHTGESLEAKSYLVKALDLWINNYDLNHPYYAHLLSSLTGVNTALGKYQEALEIAQEVSNIYKSAFGEGHPFIIENSLDLLTLYAIMSDSAQIRNIIINIFPTIKKNITYNFTYLPIKERTLFWINTKHWFESVIPRLAYRFPTLRIMEQQYNAVLLAKGILLNSEQEFTRFLTETGSDDLKEKFNEIRNLRLQINKLYEKPISERYVDTDSLEQHANELEWQLMQESAEFGDYTRNLAVTWEDVRDNLKEKDAAIEFVSFPLNNDSTMYMAYVLRKGMEAPELVKLFEEKDLFNLNDDDLYCGTKASKLLWGKLSSQLEDVENVFFAPDGILHQIAIEYFPDYEAEGMISDRYRIFRLSSTRVIALNNHRGASSDAVLYGGISYDIDVETMEAESRKYPKTTHRGFKPWYNIADSLTSRSRKGYLKHTLTEAESIYDLFRQDKKNPLLIKGNEATEESFKNLSGKKNGIIHIATHGFYWDADDAKYNANVNDRLLFMTQSSASNPRSVEDKALTRTGMFMAGANNTLSGKSLPESVDDGILTALEISQLDLRGLDLVVLSACQTGMGDISSDGVFGIQRGFKKAGANSILMSLWDVNDEATQILMTNFYKAYLSGMSKQVSLLFAQKTVRETPGFEKPEYWAAFILLDALN